MWLNGLLRSGDCLVIYWLTYTCDLYVWPFFALQVVEKPKWLWWLTCFPGLLARFFLGRLILLTSFVATRLFSLPGSTESLQRLTFFFVLVSSTQTLRSNGKNKLPLSYFLLPRRFVQCKCGGDNWDKYGLKAARTETTMEWTRHQQTQTPFLTILPRLRSGIQKLVTSISRAEPINPR